MIQVRGLTKVFPTGTKAVDNLDLDVTDGEILGLLGPNGAGKSTTIRALATLCGFDSGTVKVAGYDVDIDRSGSARPSAWWRRIPVSTISSPAAKTWSCKARCTA